MSSRKKCAINNNSCTIDEKSIVWRLHILVYFAGIASKVEGDFVELGCHIGNTAANVLKKVDFLKLGKNIIYTISGFVAYVFACSPTAMRVFSEPLKDMVETLATAEMRPDELGGASLAELLRTEK